VQTRRRIRLIGLQRVVFMRSRALIHGPGLVSKSLERLHVIRTRTRVALESLSCIKLPHRSFIHSSKFRSLLSRILYLESMFSENTVRIRIVSNDPSLRRNANFLTFFFKPVYLSLYSLSFKNHPFVHSPVCPFVSTLFKSFKSPVFSLYSVTVLRT